MTTIRHSNPIHVPPRYTAAMQTTPPPQGLGNLGRLLKDAFADTHSSYKGQLRGMDDRALAAEGKRLKKEIADASSGGDQNAGTVKRAQAQLAEVNQEKATRADIAKSPDPAYSRKAHSMSDPQLGSERARQLERYREATTGVDRDPAQAADAKSKLARLDKESFDRVIDRFQGALPKATATKPTSLGEHVGDLLKYQQMSPQQRAGERAELTRTLRDATTGPHQDVQLAANCRQKLELLGHCERPQTRPVGDGELRQYQKDLEHCSSGELKHRHDACKKEEHACHGRGDLVGAANAHRKGEACEGAMVRHRGELADCKKKVGAMNDGELRDYASKLDQQLRAPENSKPRGELCEYQQICRHEQHERLCDKHFPGTKAEPAAPRPHDERSLQDLLKDLLQGAERYQEATTGVGQHPAEGRDALKHIERDLKQLLEQLTQLMSSRD